MKRLLPLAAIEVFVWLGLLLCTFLISKLAFALSLGGESTLSRIATETIRVLVSGVIVLGWLLAWKRLTDFYFWRTVTSEASA